MRRPVPFRPLWRAVLALGLLSALAGCDGNTPAAEADGTMRVLLADMPVAGSFPIDRVAEVNVTVRGVELVPETGAPVPLMADPVGLNLLTLRAGVVRELALVPIPAGRYRQLRVHVSDDAAVVMKDGTFYKLRMAQDGETSLRVALPDFEVDEAGERIEVTLGFDIGASFQVLGEVDGPTGIQGFRYRPVVRPTAVSVNGAGVPLPGGLAAGR